MTNLFVLLALISVLYKGGKLLFFSKNYKKILTNSDEHDCDCEGVNTKKRNSHFSGVVLILFASTLLFIFKVYDIFFGAPSPVQDIENILLGFNLIANFWYIEHLLKDENGEFWY